MPMHQVVRCAHQVAEQISRCSLPEGGCFGDADHALLALNSSITNFETFAATPGFIGWQDTSPCPDNGTTWIGVTCEYSSKPYRVTTL